MISILYLFENTENDYQTRRRTLSHSLWLISNLAINYTSLIPNESVESNRRYSKANALLVIALETKTMTVYYRVAVMTNRQVDCIEQQQQQKLKYNRLASLAYLPKKMKLKWKKFSVFFLRFFLLESAYLNIAGITWQPIPFIKQ